MPTTNIYIYIYRWGSLSDEHQGMLCSLQSPQRRRQCSGESGWCDLLKSTTISFVLSTFRDRLLTLHQSVSQCTSSLYADSSLLLIRPNTVVSSVNLMMWFKLCIDAQSWVSKVNSNGLSTQPLGAPVILYYIIIIIYKLIYNNLNIQTSKKYFN